LLGQKQSGKINESGKSKGRSVSEIGPRLITASELLNRQAAFHPFKRTCGCLRCFVLASGKILKVEAGGVIYYRREEVKPLARTGKKASEHSKPGRSVIHKLLTAGGAL